MSNKKKTDGQAVMTFPPIYFLFGDDMEEMKIVKRSALLFEVV